MSTLPAVVSIERVDSPPDFAVLLRKLWAATAQHPLAERRLTTRQARNGSNVEVWVHANFGGPLLFEIGRGATPEEAAADALAKVRSAVPGAPSARPSEFPARAVLDERGAFQFAVPPGADPADFSLKGDRVLDCQVVVEGEWR